MLLNKYVQDQQEKFGVKGRIFPVNLAVCDSEKAYVIVGAWRLRQSRG
jgi:hypothetical protein